MTIQAIQEVHDQKVRLVDVVPEDYEPGDGEVDNLVYLTCRYTVDWNMRNADLQMVRIMTPKGRGTAYLNQLVLNTCEYLWDHICGEPEDFTTEDLMSAIVPILQDWYANTTESARQNTG